MCAFFISGRAYLEKIHRDLIGITIVDDRDLSDFFSKMSLLISITLNSNGKCRRKTVKGRPAGSMHTLHRYEGNTDMERSTGGQVECTQCPTAALTSQ